jgi:hypothetical protein
MVCAPCPAPMGRTSNCALRALNASAEPDAEKGLYKEKKGRRMPVEWACATGVMKPQHCGAAFLVLRFLNWCSLAVLHVSEPPLGCQLNSVFHSSNRSESSYDDIDDLNQYARRAVHERSGRSSSDNPAKRRKNQPAERRMVHKIALYFTGRPHAGENMADVLKQRAQELTSPIQMCDPLSRNTPKAFGVEILLANCMAHGRRQFVEIAPSLPDECRYVLESLGEVYCNDAMAREQP